MFPSLAGLPTYAIFQTASVVTFLLLASWYLRPASSCGRDESSAARGSKGSAVHALGLTALYVLCNFWVAKVLFDPDGRPRPLRRLPRRLPRIASSRKCVALDTRWRSLG